MRRLKLRIHEWLADRLTWVQYPKPTAYRPPRVSARPSLSYRWLALSRAGKGWVLFAVFWGSVVALSIYGNLID